jgi:LysR family glycine cleavage system transcriptional activator
MAVKTRRSGSPSEKALRRLPLNSLRVFVLAAETLNFSRAGVSLGLSTASVSMHVRALEEYLRVPLFRRRGRRVTLSAEGAMLLPRVRNALQELELSIEALRADRSQGHLTVSMLSSFLQRWLLPRLPDFHRQHPAIDLRLETSRSPADFLHTDVQLAIRLGAGRWPKLHAEKLMNEWWVVVCTPELLARHGYVERISDLQRYTLLHSTSEPWQSWPSGRAQTVWASSGSTFDDSVSVIQAAKAGYGLALARWSLAADEVADGRLALASRTIVQYEYSYYLVCPEANRGIEKVSKFSEWLHARAAEFSGPQPFLPRAA